MKALIDGDVLRYRCGFAAQHTRYTIYLNGEYFGSVTSKTSLNEITELYEDEEIEVVEQVVPDPIEYALHTVNVQIEEMLAATKADEFQVYLTGEGNFREAIATIKPYKGNRDKSHKPHHYDNITNHLINRWGAIVIEGIEADDAMAIEQMNNIVPRAAQPDPKNPTRFWLNSVICTIDKDLDMVPGNHYNFAKKESYYIDDWSAIRWFYKQLLTGDTVDNITGVPGIGDKRAEKILEEFTSLRDAFCQIGLMYAIKYDDPESALIENGRLLWMMRNNSDVWSIEKEINR